MKHFIYSVLMFAAVLFAACSESAQEDPADLALQETPFNEDVEEPDVRSEDLDVTSGSSQFTDPVFYAYCCKKFDLNSDGTIDESETKDVKKIVVNGLDVRDLKGIELFTDLEYLHCNGYQNDGDFKEHPELTSLDVSALHKLKYLDCSNNQISRLDVGSNSELVALVCDQNKIASLDLSANTKLESLLAYDNELSGDLDLSSNLLLKTVMIGSNRLTSVDVHNCEVLIDFSCKDNLITSLDLSNNSKLVSLRCQNNKLTQLDLSGNPALQILWCNGNNIESLDMTATNLGEASVPQPLVCTPMESLKEVKLKKEWKYKSRLTKDISKSVKVVYQ